MEVVGVVHLGCFLVMATVIHLYNGHVLKIDMPVIEMGKQSWSNFSVLAMPGVIRFL